MQDKEINIYFRNQAESQRVFKDLPSSSHERYIILMNETLQMENRALNRTTEELKNRVAELEEENENFDSSKRYTRGLLKNLVELERLREKISNVNKDKLTRTVNYVEQFMDNWKYYLRILQAVYAIFFAILYGLQFYTAYDYIVFAFIFVPPIAGIEMFFNNFKIPIVAEDEENIKSLETNIKKISDSQDFLNEYIDCI